MKLLDIVIIILMIGATFFAGIYYYQKNVQECTSNPLVYASQLYENNYEVKTYGTLTLMPLDHSSPTNIIFNSTGFIVLNKK